MQGIFISKEDVFVVDFIIIKSKEGTILVGKDVEEFKKDHELNEDTIEHHSVKIKVPSFKDFILSNTHSYSSDADGNIELNIWELRLSRMSVLLKEWTLKDDSGEVIAVSRENIEKLHPAIALFISEELEDSISF